MERFDSSKMKAAFAEEVFSRTENDQEAAKLDSYGRHVVASHGKEWATGGARFITPTFFTH